MSRADFSDPEIQKAVDDVKNPGSPTNWILVGYVPKSDVKLKLAESGSGGLAECSDSLSDGKVLFAFISMEVNGIKKFVYISWCGEGVTGMKKGLFSNHSTDVGKGPFNGYHVQINARNEADVAEKVITERLKKAGGASYDSGQKNQGAAKLVPTSVAQGRQQATQSNAKAKTADKTDYNKKDESAKFWQSDKQDVEQSQAQAKPAARSGYNVSNERNQFWAQNQAQGPTVQKQEVKVQSGASNIKSKFENMNVSDQPPARSNNPPPGRLAPKGNAPRPPVQEEVPQHEAPPVPEESYQEEETYQEEAPQETYEEPQETYEEEAPQEAYQEETYQEEVQDSGAAGTQVRALYDFDAQNETDLSFKEGDIINVLDTTDPSGWYKGEVGGVEGFFPSNFVENI